MAISLQKGGNISLTKTDPGLTRSIVGLGWDARTTDGSPFDLDASAILVGSNGKVRSDADFIFYHQRTSLDGAVEHQGDNLTGEGDGDDEEIKIDLSRVDPAIDRIVVVVSIYEADSRNQNFGQVRNAYVRLLNEDTGSVVVDYELSEDASSETALIFAEVYRHGSEWKFRAIGQGYNNGLAGIARDFGVNV